MMVTAASLSPRVWSASLTGGNNEGVSGPGVGCTSKLVQTGFVGIGVGMVTVGVGVDGIGLGVTSAGSGVQALRKRKMIKMKEKSFFCIVLFTELLLVIVWAVDPRHDSLESLANYLSQFAQEHLTLAKVRCLLNVPLVLPPVSLTTEIRHNLLMATREAFQNVVAHASASEARLTLQLNDDGLHISVADNGRGFEPERKPSRGNGLNNMRRRLQSIGGRLEIRSGAGQGTTVQMFVPRGALHGRVIDGSRN